MHRSFAHHSLTNGSPEPQMMLSKINLSHLLFNYRVENISWQWKKKGPNGCLGYMGDVILPSNIGIMKNRYSP